MPTRNVLESLRSNVKPFETMNGGRFEVISMRRGPTHVPVFG